MQSTPVLLQHLENQELNVANSSFRKTKIPLASHFQAGRTPATTQASPQYLISSPLLLHSSTLICQQAGQSGYHLQGHITEGCIPHPVQLDPSQDMQLNCFRVTDSGASSCQHKRGRSWFLSPWNYVTEAPVHTLGCSAWEGGMGPRKCKEKLESFLKKCIWSVKPLPCAILCKPGKRNSHKSRYGKHVTVLRFTLDLIQSLMGSQSLSLCFQSTPHP